MIKPTNEDQASSGSVLRQARVIALGPDCSGVVRCQGGQAVPFSAPVVARGDLHRLAEGTEVLCMLTASGASVVITRLTLLHDAWDRQSHPLPSRVPPLQPLPRWPKSLSRERSQRP